MKNATLDEAYTMILEAGQKQLVNAPGIPKPGSAAATGSEKDGTGGTPLKSGDTQKKPKEHPAKTTGVKPKQFSEHKEIQRMLPKSKFDELFQTTLNEEADDSLGTQPLEQTGAGEFDDDTGDFPSETSEEDIGEEVDVATKLRLIIEDLTEIAEKLGSFDDSDESGDEFDDDFSGDDLGGEDDIGAAVQRESVTYGTGGRGSAGGPGKGNHDGKINSFSSKYHKDMKVKANSVAGRQTSKGVGKHKGPNKDTSGKVSGHHADANKFKSKANMVVKNKTSSVGSTLFD